MYNIDYCLENEHKLIITTSHLSHSASNYDLERVTTQLSLGDLLGIERSSKLYEQCVYVELITENVSSNTSSSIATVAKELNLPITGSNTTNNANKRKSEFSSIADIVSKIFGQVCSKK